jgi:hypothetical protein
MKTVPTYWARIFCGLRPGYDGVAARAWDAGQIVRRYCDDVGLCATMEGTTFYYKDGVEPGVVVGLINYPRFPKTREEIRGFALELAARLRVDLKQNRVSVMFPDDTVMIGPAE